MNTFKTALITVAGLSIAAIAMLFTASLVVAFAGIATVLLAARAISLQLQQKPSRVYARARRDGQREPGRIWNDGKGTIIDM
jgi:hypothetical protein